ncbi:MAG: hypothetical protein ACREJM_01895 [Candidatus Saccharimonadales bacterium]
MNEARILPGCTTLPPMKPATNGRHAPTTGAANDGKTGGKSNAKRKTGDRFAVLNAFIDFTMGELDRGEIAVWLTLFRDTRDGVAQVSQVSIARRAGMGRRGVQKVLAKLVNKGLVKIVLKGRMGKGASRYRIRSIPPERLAHQ